MPPRFRISIAVADVNGDGHVDLILGKDENPSIEIWLNQGNGTFAEQLEPAGLIPNTPVSSDYTIDIAVKILTINLSI